MKTVLSDEQLLQLIRDDVPYGDLTTSLLLAGEELTSISFSSRQPMTLSCIEEAARMFALQGASVEQLYSSGSHIEAGVCFLKAKGDIEALFTVWKVAQILVEWASGVATATQQLVKNAGGVPVACTRKQNPGTKQLSVKAVRNGGGVIHRLGLSESILVFAEHRQFMSLSPETMLNQLRRDAPEQKIVVEVHDIDDAYCWASAGADVLQMDKFTPAQVAACAAYCRDKNLHVTLAAAGGVNAMNAADYVNAGAGLLVTSAPYHAKPSDVQVRFNV